MNAEPAPATEAPSHHDVHITTGGMERRSIFDMPYGYELTCNRVGGWTLWGPDKSRVAGEYDAGLRVDVAGHVICDSLTPRAHPPGESAATKAARNAGLPHCPQCGDMAHLPGECACINLALGRCVCPVPGFEGGLPPYATGSPEEPDTTATSGVRD